MDNKVYYDDKEYKGFYHASIMQTLRVLYEKDLKYLFSSIFVFLFKNSSVWVFPIITTDIINRVIDNQSIDDLIPGIIVLTVLIICNFPGNTLFFYLLSTGIRNMEARLRNIIIRRIQHLSMRFHDKLKSGKLYTKVLRDVEIISSTSSLFLINAIPAFFTILIAVVLTLQKTPVLTLLFLVMAPISIALQKFFEKKINKVNKDLRVNIEDMSSRVGEMLQLIPVTRSMALEEFEINKTEAYIEQVKQKGKSFDITNAYFGSIAWVVMVLFQLAILLFSCYLKYQGVISAGDIVLFQFYYSSLVGSVQTMLSIYPEFSKGIESIKSISELLDNQDLERNINKPHIDIEKGDFEFKNITFSYNPDSKRKALIDFNLKVNAGEIIGMVGESGSGKTTIINLLIGFVNQQQGEILVDGQNILDHDLRTYRKQIGIVSQQAILFSGTIKDNISYGFDVNDNEIIEAAKIANAYEFIMKLEDGFDTNIDTEDGIKLSGGQKQRITIARAIIRKPKVLILDEPTSALDSISEVEVQKALEQAMKGKTTFIVAHRLSTLRNANRIIVMKDGICIESGSRKDLLKQEGEFYRLCQSQDLI